MVSEATTVSAASNASVQAKAAATGARGGGSPRVSAAAAFRAPMRQCAMVASGVQTWMRGAIAPSRCGEGRFAACSTIAVYVRSATTFEVEKVLSGFVKSVTAAEWSPLERNVLATVDAGRVVRVWDVERETELARKEVKDIVPASVCWSTAQPGVLYLAMGPHLQYWNLATRKTVLRRGLDADLPITCVAMSEYNKTHLAFGVKGYVCVLEVATDTMSKLELAPTRGEREGYVPHAIAWDPLGASYALVATRKGHVGLYDLITKMPLMAFAKQAAGLRGLAWATGMPGTFVTFSDRAGVVRVWNASQAQPQASVRVGDGGVSQLTFLPATSSRADAPSGPDPGVMLCGMADGSALAWSLTQSRATWRVSSGHTETVFGCALCPTDADVLATCSYDGTVRLWDALSGECAADVRVAPTTSSDMVLYDLAWSPDGSRIVCSSNSGKVAVIDVVEAQVVRNEEVSTQALFGISWCTAAPYIATGSADETVYVLRASNLSTVYRLKHPSGTCGVHWSPLQPMLLAVACADANAYVWDIPQPEDSAPTSAAAPAPSPPKRLRGHTARVYGVSWSPLVPGLLLTSSDDKTIRCHRADADPEPGSSSLYTSVVMEGHTLNARALQWHAEIPYIAFSGAWDSTVRAWDVRTGGCLQVASDHHGDVYSIVCAPTRPMYLYTCSRDSTVRTWDMRSALRPLTLGLTLGSSTGELTESVVGKASEVMASPDAPPRLCGQASAELVERVQRMRAGGDRLGAHEAVQCFVGCAYGQRELWAMARKTIGAAAFEQGADDGDDLVHMRDAVDSARGQAEVRFPWRMRERTGAGAGGMRKAERGDGGAAAACAPL